MIYHPLVVIFLIVYFGLWLYFPGGLTDRG